MKKKVSVLFGVIFAVVFAFALTACGKVSLKLTFKVDGVDYATISTSGDEVIKMPENPTKDGYVFDGWFWDEGTWQKPFTANSLFDTPLSSDMSVYAKFVTEHVHEYSVKNASPEYLATPATCTEKAKYYYSCSCGEKGTETFESGEPKGHTYSTNWWSDDTYHWRKAVCEHTTEIKDKEEHKFYEGVCECGYVIYISNLLDLRKTDSGYEVCGYNGKAEKVIIPKEYKGLPVVSIGEKAFRDKYTGHSNLIEIFIPDSVKKIGDEAFYNCDSLTSITLGKNITDIGSGAFYSCSNLTSITIPDSVTSIGSGAFSGCTALTSIVIPDGVTSIEGYTFSGCAALTSITIPNSVTSIEGYAFSGCTALTSITIPDGVEFIMQYAFGGCTALTRVTIGDSVRGIGGYAFKDCSSLTSVTVPDSVVNIGLGAFDGCNNLCVNSYDNAEYLGNETNSYVILFKANNKEISDVTINVQTKTIACGAFMDCTALTSITVPSNVKLVGSYVFSGCTGLKNIKIEEGVEWIESVFRLNINGYGQTSCTALESVTIPKSIKGIHNQTFDGCNPKMKIFYEGNEKDWNKQEHYFTPNNMYYYSETEPELNSDGTAYNGNYWRYVGGVPTVWKKES